MATNPAAAVVTTNADSLNFAKSEYADSLSALVCEVLREDFGFDDVDEYECELAFEFEKEEEEELDEAAIGVCESIGTRIELSWPQVDLILLRIRLRTISATEELPYLFNMVILAETAKFNPGKK